MAVRRRGEATVLAELRQSGCLKARFPRGGSGGWFDLVTLNISGGVAGGDRLESDFAVGAGASATIAGQAAERFYRASPQTVPARLRTTITVAAGGAAEWLPQQSILFDGCALDRMLCVELAEDACFLGAESLVFGRAAMGEAVVRGTVRDAIRVRRDGRLVVHDAIRLDGVVAAHLLRPAVAGGARAVATLIHVAPDAEESLNVVRSAMIATAEDANPFSSFPRKRESMCRMDARFRGHDENESDERAIGIRRGHEQSGNLATAKSWGGHDDTGIRWEAGVSAWDGMLLARILAPDGASLRAAVVAGLRAIRGERMLPRVWLC